MFNRWNILLMHCFLMFTWYRSVLMKRIGSCQVLQHMRITFIMTTLGTQVPISNYNKACVCYYGIGCSWIIIFHLQDYDRLVKHSHSISDTKRLWSNNDVTMHIRSTQNRSINYRAYNWFFLTVFVVPITIIKKYYSKIFRLTVFEKNQTVTSSQLVVTCFY